jgi:hypothetical protein
VALARHMPTAEVLKSKSGEADQAEHGPFDHSHPAKCVARRLVMNDVIFVYQNRSDARFYDASTRQVRGGPGASYPGNARDQ